MHTIKVMLKTMWIIIIAACLREPHTYIPCSAVSARRRIRNMLHVSKSLFFARRCKWVSFFFLSFCLFKHLLEATTTAAAAAAAATITKMPRTENTLQNRATLARGSGFLYVYCLKPLALNIFTYLSLTNNTQPRSIWRSHICARTSFSMTRSNFTTTMGFQTNHKNKNYHTCMIFLTWRTTHTWECVCACVQRTFNTKRRREKKCGFYKCSAQQVPWRCSHVI